MLPAWNCSAVGSAGIKRGIVTGAVLCSILGANAVAVPGPKEPQAGSVTALKKAAGDVHYTKLTILGETLDKGVFDASIAYAPDKRTGWLAYSWAGGNGNLIGGRVSVGEYVSTHLARTDDAGKTWKFVAAVNVSGDGTCRMPDGVQLNGVWRYEVPSLVCDPLDPDRNRKWKLFVHHYFWERGRDSRPAYGWIGLRTASEPDGKWSEEIPLFGAGGNPPGVYHVTQVDVNRLDPSLKNVVAYTEPGALVDQGQLYLALTALKPRIGVGGVSIEYSIILLVSADHGRAWTYAGTLLTAADARAFGYDYFDSTDLTEEDGRVFLLAVPGSKPKPLHDGCVVFEVESLAAGRLKRDSTDKPVVVSYLPPQPSILSGPGAGQSTYDSANVNGGLIFNQFNLGAAPEVFQLYQTNRRLADKKHQ